MRFIVKLIYRLISLQKKRTMTVLPLLILEQYKNSTHWHLERGGILISKLDFTLAELRDYSWTEYHLIALGFTAFSPMEQCSRYYFDVFQILRQASFVNLLWNTMYNKVCCPFFLNSESENWPNTFRW